MKLPNLIIAGAPKCGTSSLYFWLAAHPDVFASRTKETFYFADKINHFNKKCNCIEHPIENYAKFFSQSKTEKLRFEATAAYLYSDNALEELLKFKEPPYIIFSFREPSAQIYSHYKMEKYRTKKVDLPLKEYVQLKKINNYVQYAKHLKKWLSVYPKEKIKVLIFEDLMKNKKSRMKELTSFLDIDKKFYENYNFEQRNESVTIRARWIHEYALKIQHLIPHKIQKYLLPIYMIINSTGKTKNNPEDINILLDIKEKYKSVREELKAIMPDLPLHHWD